MIELCKVCKEILFFEYEIILQKCIPAIPEDFV